MREGFAKDLSLIIPARNEQFSRATVEDALAHSHADTEVIFVADGSWPNPPLDDHPRLKVIHTTEAVGQRAATNIGVGLSRAKYVMKADAHMAFDDGFDVQLIKDMQPDWTMIPMMYRLHVFDWTCNNCGHGTYQGSKPEKCAECSSTDLYMRMIWTPKWSVGPTVSWRFDSDMHFQYWNKHKDRPEVKAQVKAGLVETMSCVGCCFIMERMRFRKLGGMDERHGSWGQYGTELACKAWLSGGKMVTNTKTWTAHLFRTGNFSANGETTFPYPLTGAQQEAARKYSRDLWLKDRWPQAVRKLSWLVEKFAPVPGWHDGDTNT